MEGAREGGREGDGQMNKERTWDMRRPKCTTHVRSLSLNVQDQLALYHAKQMA